MTSRQDNWCTISYVGTLSWFRLVMINCKGFSLVYKPLKQILLGVDHLI